MSDTADTLNTQRPFKILTFGHAKAGKTHFTLSIIEALAAHGYEPKDILFGFVDMDDGAIPLFEKGVVARPYMKSILYQLCTSFDQVSTATTSLIPRLQAHQREHGLHSAWLIHDNMEQPWLWARDKFAMDVYGMPEHELALRRRIEAQSMGKKSLPVMQQMTDYGVINPIHNTWAEAVKLSGLNVVWTSPVSEEYDDHGKKTGNIRPKGQKLNPHRMDHILYLHRDGGRHLLDVLGTRYGQPTTNIPASFTAFLGSTAQHLLDPPTASAPRAAAPRPQEPTPPTTPEQPQPSEPKSAQPTQEVTFDDDF